MMTKHGRKWLSIIAVILVMLLLLCACGKTENETSSGDASGSDVSDSADASATDSQASDGASDTGSANNGTTSAASNGNGGGTGGNGGNGGGTGGNGGGTTTGKSVWGSDPYANIPAEVKSKGVHVLMWREYTNLEKKLVDDFQKKTGIKVRTTVSGDSEGAYGTKLVSLVSGKDSPDVVALESYNFPSFAVRALQPLDTAVYRLDDSCWNKTYMDSMKVNNRYFGVGISGSWNVDDCLYATYYSPKVLKACGITTMPYDLYKQGKWNWKAQHDIAKQIKQAGKNYIGLSWQSSDLFMLSAGTDFVGYDGKRFSNNLGSVSGSSMLTKAWQEVATLRSEGLSSEWSLSNVQQGKCGLFSAITFGMQTEARWFPNMASDIQCVPVAGPDQNSAYVPARPKLWGTAKGAKNPEGAAYFLRYFLDPKNCDMKGSFVNSQFEEVFNKITASSAKKQVLRGWGITNYLKSGEYYVFCYALNETTPANVTTVLNQKKSSLQSAINKANKDLQKIK